MSYNTSGGTDAGGLGMGGGGLLRDWRTPGQGGGGGQDGGGGVQAPTMPDPPLPIAPPAAPPSATPPAVPPTTPSTPRGERTPRAPGAPTTTPTPPATTPPAGPSSWTLRPDQAAVAAQAGITDEFRFDPNWWLPGWQAGGRRPDKVIWDTWTPEEQALFGGWDAYKARGQPWRAEIADQRQGEYAQLAALKAQYPQITLEQALGMMGISNQREQGKSLWNELMGMQAGTIRGGYHLDPSSGMKYDTATSDLNVRGLPQAMDAEDWRFYTAMTTRGGDFWPHIARLAQGQGGGGAAGARLVGSGSTPAAAAATAAGTSTSTTPGSLGTGPATGPLGNPTTGLLQNPGQANPNWTGPGSLRPGLAERDRGQLRAPAKDPNLVGPPGTPSDSGGFTNTPAPREGVIGNRPPITPVGSGTNPLGGYQSPLTGAPQVGVPGSGGGGGGARPGGPAGAPGSMSQAEAEFMAALTELARKFQGQGAGLYGIGNDAWTQAVRYYETLLGRGGRYAAQNAVSPQAQNINDVYRGAKASVGAGFVSGGAKDLANSELERERARSIANLYTGVQPEAANQLGGLGMQGVAAGTQLQGLAAQTHGGLLSALTQNRQFGLGLNENSRQFDSQLAAQIGMNNAALQMQAQAMQMQERLSQAQMAMQALQFDRTLDWQKNAFGQTLSAQRSAGTGSFFGQLLGTLVPLLIPGVPKSNLQTGGIGGGL